MIRIKILSVGKTKEQWLEEAIKEYIKRLSTQVMFEQNWAKNDSQLIEWTEKEENIICLDPQGKQFTSEEFALFISRQWEKGGSRVTLVIGGAEGLPIAIKEKGVLVSLSSLTFTHQLSRLILVEQIYRATEILKGSNYHK